MVADGDNSNDGRIDHRHWWCARIYIYFVPHFIFSCVLSSAFPFCGRSPLLSVGRICSRQSGPGQPHAFSILHLKFLSSQIFSSRRYKIVFAIFSFLKSDDDGQHHRSAAVVSACNTSNATVACQNALCWADSTTSHSANRYVFFIFHKNIPR